MTNEESKKLLGARLEDLMERSGRGYITVSSFLDPSELFFSLAHTKKLGKANSILTFGGYPEAERRCLFFLPDYISDNFEGEISEVSARKLIGDEIKSNVSAIRIIGSGYRKLSHRDYLGAVLNLGIERSAIGDICVIDDNSAIIFALSSVARLILSDCERIGSDKVKIEETDIFSDFTFEKKTRPISDTVASDRLDCVISALTNESRDKAKSSILSGLVECNYSPATRTDMRIQNGDVITVHGSGKFIIVNITEETKKGRLRLSAKKYI